MLSLKQSQAEKIWVTAQTPFQVFALIDNGNNRFILVNGFENSDELLQPGGISFLLHPGHSEVGMKRKKLLES